MVRPLRIEYPGALYHLTTRGNGLDWIYLDDKDRQAFLALLREGVGSFNWALHAYCLPSGLLVGCSLGIVCHLECHLKAFDLNGFSKRIDNAVKLGLNNAALVGQNARS